eukprot:11986616-Alexandrium_andersonii.AAC.1
MAITGTGFEAADPWAGVNDAVYIDNGIERGYSAFQICAAIGGGQAAWWNLPRTAQAAALAA